jgi:hypothetical protein
MIVLPLTLESLHGSGLTDACGEFADVKHRHSSCAISGLYVTLLSSIVHWHSFTAHQMTSKSES